MLMLLGGLVALHLRRSLVSRSFVWEKVRKLLGSLMMGTCGSFPSRLVVKWEWQLGERRSLHIQQKTLLPSTRGRVQSSCCTLLSV